MHAVAQSSDARSTRSADKSLCGNRRRGSPKGPVAKCSVISSKARNPFLFHTFSRGKYGFLGRKLPRNDRFVHFATGPFSISKPRRVKHREKRKQPPNPSLRTSAQHWCGNPFPWHSRFPVLPPAAPFSLLLGQRAPAAGLFVQSFGQVKTSVLTFRRNRCILRP